jgi:hypothetical protein
MAVSAEKVDVYRFFGCSPETECGWPQSEAHAAFVLAFIEAELRLLISF